MCEVALFAMGADGADERNWEPFQKGNFVNYFSKASPKVATAPREPADVRAKLDALPLVPVVQVAPPAPPSHEEIAIRAYYIFLLKGCEHGHCHDNWHQAERELTGTRSVWAREEGHEIKGDEYHPTNTMPKNTPASMSTNKVGGI